MRSSLPTSVTVRSDGKSGHLQGIALDEKNGFFYCSFTTCLIKTDLNGKTVGSVRGIVGHLGCIAYNSADGKVYGSLEYKSDAIGRGILRSIGYTGEIRDGFYAVRFDVSRIDRMDMDAERDGIMEAVYLGEVWGDYSAEGHRYGCSGIDGITFAPKISEDSPPDYLYVAYGVYGDTSRDDNDHQVILCYDVSEWDSYAAPLIQSDMHRRGPEKPTAKYFVYTGNTTYGVQNLEYDPYTRTMLAAVYCGKKEGFPNYSMFFIDCTKAPEAVTLKGVGHAGLKLLLTDPSGNVSSDIPGSRFPLGATGMISLGDGYYYFADSFKDELGFAGTVRLYRISDSEPYFIPVS